MNTIKEVLGLKYLNNPNSKKKDLQTLELFAKRGIVDLYYFDESGFNLTPNIP